MSEARARARESTLGAPFSGAGMGWDECVVIIGRGNLVNVR
jgi:hypothetical protein